MYSFAFFIKGKRHYIEADSMQGLLAEMDKYGRPSRVYGYYSCPKFDWVTKTTFANLYDDLKKRV